MKPPVTEPTLRISQYIDPQASSESSDSATDSDEEIGSTHPQWEEMKLHIEKMHDEKSNEEMQYDNVEKYVS